MARVGGLDNSQQTPVWSGDQERFEMASKLTPADVTPHASLETNLHGTHVPPFLPSFCSPYPPCYVLHCRSVHHCAHGEMHAAELYSCAFVQQSVVATVF